MSGELFLGIPTHRHEDGGVAFVAVKPMAAALGLSWAGQSARLRRDPVLSPERRFFVVRTEGGPQRMLFVPEAAAVLWLIGIESARVDPASREAVTAARRKAFAVLGGALL